jgi:hypothetical protein
MDKLKIVRFIILIYNLDTRDDFDEKNYSLKFNHPSFTEIAMNVYDFEFMKTF